MLSLWKTQDTHKQVNYYLAKYWVLGRKLSYFFMYQNLMCADGDQAHSSKTVFPKLQRKLGLCPGLEQSLEQILGPVSMNLAGSKLAVIHFSSSAFKNACERLKRLSSANMSPKTRDKTGVTIKRTRKC